MLSQRLIFKFRLLGVVFFEDRPALHYPLHSWRPLGRASRPNSVTGQRIAGMKWGRGFRNANQAVVAGMSIRLSRLGTDAIEHFWRSRLRRRLPSMRTVHQISERRKANAMPDKKVTKKSAMGTAANRSVFSEDEKAAMRELVRERQRSGEADGEAEVLAKIAEMQEPDRAMAKRVHAVVKASAPAISPKTWYGMPAYAKDG